MSYDLPTDEEGARDVMGLSFEEILIDALICQAALVRTLPKSSASDALKKRIETLRAEARRRDAMLGKASTLLNEIEKLEASIDEKKGRARHRPGKRESE